MTVVQCGDRLYLWGRSTRKSRGAATMDDLVRIGDEECTAAIFVKAYARASIGRMAAKAARMIGGHSPVPSEPWRAR